MEGQQYKMELLAVTYCRIPIEPYQKDIWGSVMFELSLYLPPSHSPSRSLLNSFKAFSPSGLSSHGHFTWECTRVLSMTALTLAFRKSSLSLKKKKKRRQKGFACRPFNHKLQPTLPFEVHLPMRFSMVWWKPSLWCCNSVRCWFPINLVFCNSNRTLCIDSEQVRSSWICRIVCGRAP